VESARRATEADVPRIVELAAAARAELGAFERGGALFVLREAGAAPVVNIGLAVVGTVDDVVVGYGLPRVEDLPDGSRLGVVDELFVEAGARGVGVGEAMIGALLDWFRAQGCLGVDAAALPGARATKNFFETFGFTARLLIVHRRLDRGDGQA
jgi:GNAT superfamily N-acetyltransferase